MASAWDIISSSAILVVFLGIVYAAIKISGTVSESTNATVSSLQSKGVTYQDGKLKVQTDRTAPSREEYIAQTQRAFEKGAKTLSAHPEAFKTGVSSDGSVGSTTGVETPEKKGFRRTKKLA